MPLPDGISPVARQTIQAAVDNLESAISLQDRVSLEGTTLDDVRHAAIGIEEQLEARQCMRNMRRLTPLFDGLGHYSKSIEVLCDGTPYLPYIWAPIKLILKFSSVYIEAFEKIMKTYARIATCLSKFKSLQPSLSNQPLMQDMLAMFYATILELHKETYSLVRRGGWRILFETSWGRFERRFDVIIEALFKCENLIHQIANGVDIHSANAMDVVAWRQQELMRLSVKEEQDARDQYSRIAWNFRANETDQIRIFGSIFSKAAGESKEPWILTQPQVQDWMRTTKGTEYLVLHGQLGAGKSVLATQIATCLRSSDQTQVIAHFNSYSSPTSVKYVGVLKSIILQLIKPHPDLIIYTFDQLIMNGNKITASFLDKVFMNIIQVGSPTPSQTKSVHFIFDGLDECDLSVQNKVMSLSDRIVSLAASSSSNVIIRKVMVFRRLDLENDKKMRGTDQVFLANENESVNAALLAYSLDRLEAMSPQLSAVGMSSVDIEILASNIVEKADGIFLWARLVLDCIASNLFFQGQEILLAADYFSTEWSEFYDTIFAHLISRLDIQSREKLKSILGWIAFAKRPLKTGEFLSVLTFNGITRPYGLELPPADIFDICAPMIECHQNTWTFVHVSVKEYLQNGGSYISLDEWECAFEHAQAVSTCLLFSLDTFHTPQAPRLGSVAKGVHGFLIYATEHWSDYLLALLCFVDLRNSLFFNQSRHFATEMHAWAQIVNITLKGEDVFNTRQNAVIGFNTEFSTLFDVLKATLGSKKSDAEPERLRGGDTFNLRSLLVQYQQAVEQLLPMPGLERFQQEFRPMAFACRVWPCPYTSTSFNTDSERDEHEATHAKAFCREFECQYSAFNSLSDLIIHQSTHHAPRPRVRGRSTIKINRTQPMTRGHQDESNVQFQLSSSLSSVMQDMPGYYPLAGPSHQGPPPLAIPTERGPQLMTPGGAYGTEYDAFASHSVDPSIQTTASPFLLQTTASPFPLQTTASPFPLQTTASPFPLQTTASPFLLQPPTSPFLLQPPASPFLLQPPASPFLLQPPASPFLLQPPSSSSLKRKSAFPLPQQAANDLDRPLPLQVVSSEWQPPPFQGHVDLSSSHPQEPDESHHLFQTPPSPCQSALSPHQLYNSFSN